MILRSQAMAYKCCYTNTPEEHRGVDRAGLALIRGLNPDGSIKTVVLREISNGRSSPTDRYIGKWWRRG